MNNLSDEVLATAKRYAAEVCKKDDAMYILDLVTFAAELLQQNFCKPDVVRCKELLVQILNKEQELADINSNIDLRKSGQNYRNIEKIRMALMLIDELPAL